MAEQLGGAAATYRCQSTATAPPPPLLPPLPIHQVYVLSSLECGKRRIATCYERNPTKNWSCHASLSLSCAGRSVACLIAHPSVYLSINPSMHPLIDPLIGPLIDIHSGLEVRPGDQGEPPDQGGGGAAGVEGDHVPLLARAEQGAAGANG